MRPWLLIPKVIAFTLYVGGLAAVLGLWLASDFASLDLHDPRRQFVLAQVRSLMIFLVVPALLLAIALGIGLLMQFPRQLLRMRWMQVKLVSLFILVPLAHLYCESRFVALRRVTEQAASDQYAAQFTVGLLAVLVGSIWIVVLGRLKPRFGQNIAKAHLPDQPDATNQP